MRDARGVDCDRLSFVTSDSSVNEPVVPPSAGGDGASPSASDRRLMVAAWTLVAWAAGVWAVTLVVGLDRLGAAGLARRGSLGAIAGGVVLPVLAALVLQHRPRNRVAWLIMASGLGNGLSALADTYAASVFLARPAASWPGASVAAWLAGWLLPASFSFFVVAVAVFPDGRPQTRPHRLVFGMAVAGAAVLVIGLPLASWPARGVALLDTEHAPPGPVGVRLMAAAAVGQGLVTLALLAAIIRMGIVVRRSAGASRQQLKWFLFGAVVAIAGFVSSAIAPEVAAQTLNIAGRVAVVAAMAVAISRHRLYDIDRLVNRTLTYVLATGSCLIAYVVTSIAVGALVGRGRLQVAAGTLLAAAVFRPARSRVQRWVDWRLDRATAVATREVQDFIARLQAGRARPAEVVGTLRSALRDPGLTVAFFDKDGNLVDLDGRATTASPAAVVVAGQDGPLAAIGTARTTEGSLLTSVIDAAHFPLEVARLEAQLQVRLAEVQASRARLVAAGDAERRRMERDIHDGAQQRLVALGLRLRLAEDEASDDPRIRSLVGRTVTELEAAIGELRELAHGLYPTALAEDGLVGAIHTLAARTPVPITIDATWTPTDPLVELTGWFVVSESVANAVKHSAARSIVVLLSEGTGGTTVIEVRDDGVGGATYEAGSGLSGLRDRIEAVGGTMTLTSDHGSGTTIQARLPCTPP